MTAAGLLSAATTAATGTSLTESLGLSGTRGSAQSTASDDKVARGSEVIADADGSGVEVSQRFFESSDTVVVSSPAREDQLRAAAIAVELGAPMLTRYPAKEAGSNPGQKASPGTGEAVDAEIARLGATNIITAPLSDDAPGTVRGVTIADVEPVRAGKGSQVQGVVDKRHGGRDAVAIFATETTSLAAAATTTASGRAVSVLPHADPRATAESMKAVGAKSSLALGRQFGTNEDYADRVKLASNGELPGGGGLVFPGRRMIALYGHPSGPALGAMGEQPPKEAVERLKGLVDEYQKLTPEPVIPAFEIIATVASESPGDDGNFTNETDPKELIPYIDAITEAGGYAVIDLQPGLGRFIEQAKIYENLLKRPNVGLALDPEWKLKPGQRPAEQIGSVQAEEINEVTAWLAKFTRDNNLPQKALLIHEFNVAMLPDRENIDTSAPELSFVLHADGHGTAHDKFATWDVLLQGLDPAFFVAWKNFFDEDQPMFDPTRTFTEVKPRPWFVSYQ
ncbi:cell wall-binding repeat-containing protein [Corynebacterium aquatimens]